MIQDIWPMYEGVPWRANILAGLIPNWKFLVGLWFVLWPGALSITSVFASSQITTIRFGSESFEPFFSSDFKSGIFVELIKEAFSRAEGYQVEFVKMARKRIAVDLAKGKIDAGFNIFKSQELPNVYISLPFFRWSDFAYYKRESKIKIRDFSDFKGLSLVTYPNAKQYNGKNFVKMTGMLKSYKELAQQDNIGKMLVKDRADVVWQDINTALHTLSVMMKVNVSDYEFVELQKSAFTYIGFKDEKHRDTFNEAAVSMMIDGTYEKIYQRHQKKFGFVPSSNNIIRLNSHK